MIKLIYCSDLDNKRFEKVEVEEDKYYRTSTNDYIPVRECGPTEDAALISALEERIERYEEIVERYRNEILQTRDTILQTLRKLTRGNDEAKKENSNG